MDQQMPTVPVDALMPQTANLVVALLNYTVLLVVAVLMVRASRRTGSLLPLFCLLGGAVSFLMEPIYDIVGSVWYPADSQLTLFRAFNVAIPAWLLPAYAWYIGGQGYLMFRKFESGINASQLWRFYLLFWLSNLALEVPGLTLGIYVYYGPQPFKLFGFPLWMAMTNSLMPIVLGATYHSFGDILKGRSVWLAVPMVPMAIGFCQIAAGWPTWLALNSGKGLLVTDAAATVSLLLSMTVVYLVSRKFCLPVAVMATPKPAPPLSKPLPG
jgi:hypothetical protein